MLLIHLQQKWNLIELLRLRTLLSTDMENPKPIVEDSYDVLIEENSCFRELPSSEFQNCSIIVEKMSNVFDKSWEPALSLTVM